MPLFVRYMRKREAFRRKSSPVVLFFEINGHGHYHQAGHAPYVHKAEKGRMSVKASGFGGSLDDEGRSEVWRAVTRIR